jgi:hypothetical protein
MIGFSSSNDVGSARDPQQGAVEHRARLQRRHQRARLGGRIEHAGRVHDQHRLTTDIDVGWRDPRADDHRFHTMVERRQHLVRPGDQLLEAVDRKGVRGVRERGGHGVHTQMEASDHTEESRARSAGGPVQVGVVLGVGVHELARGGHDIDAQHVLATPAPLTRVPSLPALQEVATEPDGRAMAARKDQPVPAQERAQLLTAANGRADGGGHRFDIDRHLAQASQIDQQRVVAHAPARPRVTAGPRRDLPTALSGQVNSGDHVGHVGGLQDGDGKACGVACVEQRLGACGFVVGASSFDVPPDEHSWP